MFQIYYFHRDKAKIKHLETTVYNIVWSGLLLAGFKGMEWIIFILIGGHLQFMVSLVSITHHMTYHMTHHMNLNHMTLHDHMTLYWPWWIKIKIELQQKTAL